MRIFAYVVLKEVSTVLRWVTVGTWWLLMGVGTAFVVLEEMVWGFHDWLAGLASLEGEIIGGMLYVEDSGVNGGGGVS